MGQCVLTQNEKEYLSDFYTEFGAVFGSNSACRAEPKTKPQMMWPPIAPKQKTRPYSVLSDIEREAILGLRKQGVPYKEIESKFNVTSATIWLIQRVAGYGYPNYING